MIANQPMRGGKGRLPEKLPSLEEVERELESMNPSNKEHFDRAECLFSKFSHRLLKARGERKEEIRTCATKLLEFIKSRQG